MTGTSADFRGAMTTRRARRSAHIAYEKRNPSEFPDGSFFYFHAPAPTLPARCTSTPAPIPSSRPRPASARPSSSRFVDAIARRRTIKRSSIRPSRPYADGLRSRGVSRPFTLNPAGNPMKKVAFICVHNSCRSQIAEALGKLLAADVFESYSAGTALKSAINPDAVRIMKELYNVDMTATQRNKLIGEIPAPDLAISMGCGVVCPFIGREFDDDWGLADPTGKSDDEFRETIREIERRVLALRDKLAAER